MKLKRTFAVLAATLFLGVIGTSCAPKEEDDVMVEQATLSLSSDVLTLDNSAQSPTAPQITVTTNQTKWTASAPADWLSVSKEGNGLLISALANDLGRDRVGEVLVFAGGLVEKLSVTQSAADIVIEVSPEELNVPNIGGEFRIDIRSNADAWEVEVAEECDWITIGSRLSDFVKVVVKPNEIQDSRTGKIYARSGKNIKEIVINQVGNVSSDYILPLFNVVPTRFQVINHEAKQGGFLVKYSGPLPSWGIFEESYEFACASPNIVSVVYSIDSKSSFLNSITQISTEPSKIFSPDYINFIKANGFEITDQTDNSIKAVNEEASFELEAKEASGIVQIQFTGSLKQDKEYKTFDKFPYDRSDWVLNTQMTFAKIIAKEKSEGGKVEAVPVEGQPGKYQLLQVEVAKKYRPLHTRLFFAASRKISEKEVEYLDFISEEVGVWTELNLGAWEMNGIFTLTNEFKDLLKKEGFELWKTVQADSYYRKPIETGFLVIVPRGARFSDLLDGKPVFAINYFKKNATTSAQINDPKFSEQLLDEVTERVQNIDEQLGRIK